MTKDEGKGQKGKERAGNEAGNRPSAEEGESSKQLAEEENKENMQTGTVIYKRGRGRPRVPLPSAEAEAMERKRGKKKRNRDRDCRAKQKLELKCELEELERQNEMLKLKLETRLHFHFPEMPRFNDRLEGITTVFFKINEESLKGVTGQQPDWTGYVKQPGEYLMGMTGQQPEWTGYIKQPGEYLMLEHQARKAFCKMPGINDMFKPFNEEFMKINAESLKGITEQAPELTEYLKRPEKYLMLEHQACKAFCKMPGINDMFEPFNEEFMKVNAESLKGMAEQEPELTEYFKQPDEYFMSKFIRKWQELFQKLFEEEGTTEKFKAVWLKEHQLLGHCFPERDEPSGTAPLGDHNVANIAANPPQLQIANTGTNNVEQEDNTANQENEAAEAAHNTGIVAAATSGSWYS